jgi:hypothetical protein
VKTTFLIIAATTFGVALQVQPAFAQLTEVTAHVTEAEPTYMPGKISFSLDTGSSVCPSTGFFLD